MIKDDKLISTAIMKTDIIGFSHIVDSISDVELSNLLEDYKEFIIRIIYKYDGAIIKGEGDAFLISYSSVTSATKSAIEIQTKLKKIKDKQGKSSQLALRIMITVGDVLHKNNDVYGESVNVISRIEDITPPDEIYLSEPAYLTLRKNKINVDLVGSFDFKGFTNAQKVYKIILGRKTQIIPNQYIVFTDLDAFGKIKVKDNFDLFENNIDKSDVLIQQTIKKFNGIIRNIMADSFLLTFNNINDLIHAISFIMIEWEKLCENNNLCRMRIGCHVGEIMLYRTCLSGKAFNIAARLETYARNIPREGESTNKVIAHMSSTIYKEAIEYNKDIKKSFRRVNKQKFFNNLEIKAQDYFSKIIKSSYVFYPQSLKQL